jgi:O-antigen biosynthesis protein WbqV
MLRDSTLKKAVRKAHKFPSTARRSLIMLMDFAVTLIAIPATLSFTRSVVLNQPITSDMVVIWIGGGLVAHLLFRFNGLYDTLWRFASTQDFFNIIKNCFFLTVLLYASVRACQWINPFLGINEREFLIFFLLEFTLISGPRLLYRYLLDGDRWKVMGGWGKLSPARRALFLGLPEDADLAVRFVRSREFMDTEIVGIIGLDSDLSVGSVQGIPFLGTADRFASIIDEIAESTHMPEVLIVGPNVENETENFVELVRLARKRRMDVTQFRGISAFPQKGGSKLAFSQVDMETLLRRPAVSIQPEELRSICRGQRVLVTGGAGSIGSQIALRALELGAAKVLVIDRSEPAVFALSRRIPEHDLDRFQARVVDICRPELLRPVMRDFRADVIFHAAALKHVPLLEIDWVSAIDVNVMGTLNCAELASEFSASQFVLISSDKAAEPESILGLTKRMAEQIVNTLHAGQSSSKGQTRFHAVRFGNVFASNGSASTVFSDQIEAGGPVTVTDPKMTRYFMILDEAVDLVLLAAANASKRDMKASGIYMLDMGEPIKILDMAENMIRLAGKIPHKEIEIVFTGGRPGEKICEVLVSEGETIIDIGVDRVHALTSAVMSAEQLKSVLRTLDHAVKKEDKKLAVTAMQKSWRNATFSSNIIDLYSSE